LPAVRNSG